jgi:hypothetical protein
MFDQGARQLGGGGDRNNAEEEGEKAMKGIEEQFQQASQGVMEVFTKVGACAPHNKKMHDALILI